MISSMSSKGSSRLEPDERWRKIDNKPVGPSAIHNPTPMSAWGRGKVKPEHPFKDPSRRSVKLI